MGDGEGDLGCAVLDNEWPFGMGCNLCVLCDASCGNCDGETSSDCIDCQNSEFLHLGTCLAVCPDGFYGETIAEVCDACDETCATCYGDYYSACITCYDGDFFYENQCLTACPDGTYASGSDCLDCDIHCLTCSSSTDVDCLSCYSGDILFESSCYFASCPEGYTLVSEVCEEVIEEGQFGANLYVSMLLLAYLVFMLL